MDASNLNIAQFEHVKARMDSEHSLKSWCVVSHSCDRSFDVVIVMVMLLSPTKDAVSVFDVDLEMINS
jgi:hypothetical protein